MFAYVTFLPCGTLCLGMNSMHSVPRTLFGIPFANLPSSFAVDRNQVSCAGPLIRSSIDCFLPSLLKMWKATMEGFHMCEGVGAHILGNGAFGMI